MRNLQTPLVDGKKLTGFKRRYFLYKELKKMMERNEK
jgi:hypothetical protein